MHSPFLDLEMTTISRSSPSGESIADFFDTISGFQAGTVMKMESNLPQVIAIINSGKFKIVQKQLVSETISLSTVISVSRMPLKREKTYYAFKLSYTADTSILQSFSATYGVLSESVQNLWMISLLEALVPTFPSGKTKGYLSLHQCYLRMNQHWTTAWVVLTGSHELIFHDKDGETVEVDLRKLRSLDHCQDFLELNSSNKILQIRIFDITSAWRQSVLDCATNEFGVHLEDQKLTGDNVPVVVAKCLDFIFVHGITSEGIYRLSGTTSKVKKLLDEFSKNPFEMTIRAEDYTEHDVASAVKKFMRDLADPVVGELALQFMVTAEIDCPNARINELKRLIGQLPAIRFNTFREIIKHLNLIQQQKHLNKMNTTNLAVVWGKNLLRVENMEGLHHMIVLSDVITHMDFLFDLKIKDCNTDLIFFKAMQKQEERAATNQACDFIVWIKVLAGHFNTGNREVQVSLSSTKSVTELFQEMAPRFGVGLDEFVLKEVLLGGDMFRYMSPSEIVLNTIMKWSNWPVTYGQNNYLEFVSKRYILSANRNADVTQDFYLNFADSKSRHWHPHFLHIVKNKVVWFGKTKSSGDFGPHEQHLENVMPYLGREKKRKLKGRWAITLIDNGMRSIDTQFIGHVLTVKNETDMLQVYRVLSDRAHKE